MARFTLYVYADGNDLELDAPIIEQRTREFIQRASWRHATPRLVNQRYLDSEALQPGDLPDWDLGLNLDLPDVPAEAPGWFADVEQIVAFVAELRSSTGRGFVVGIYDHEHEISEDLMAADATESGLTRLRTFIGVGT